MAIVQLPIEQNSAHFSFRCELDSVTYTFTFRWNNRAEGWYLSLGDGDGDDIVSGIRVVVNYQLFSRYGSEGLPPGTLFAIDTAGEDLDPAFEDLGRRTVLYYASPGDI